MTEYQIQPNTRRCAITGREFRPGETYFTALVEADGQFVRQDYSGEAWTGPPARRLQLLVGPGAQRYRAAKAAVRRRSAPGVLRAAGRPTGAGPREFSLCRGFAAHAPQTAQIRGGSTEDGHEVLLLRCVRTGAKHQVRRTRACRKTRWRRCKKKCSRCWVGNEPTRGEACEMSWLRLGWPC